ncbi:putative RNA methyltransferase [Arthrobacter sp. VKM Ac-2550]|uniref:putative RNA methyltransferase n=1 Tax=Crystallibacter permensis TaxID=1938888 RepID=UPI002227D887|nr:methyltransferase domain-containing protein [Arthrobacter sp. VKM Ac-2550]MCW2133957.1 23S rRNA m(1)G-748 methyltransferase [Arthrobacter sp. VKM Ac-2550]
MPSLSVPLESVDLLLCPVCAEDMRPNEDSVAGGISCAAGHRFDGAKQGYVNLLTGRGTSFIPDTADMVAARSAFLDDGHYDPLLQQVAGTVSALLEGVERPVIVDAGAGTGHYLAAALGAVPAARAVALDLSKFALRRAARSVPRALCLVWDLWRPLPLAGGAVDLIINVFAPRNAEEYARILKPGGHLLVVTPAPGHLDALRARLPLLAVDDDKSDRLAAALAQDFTPVSADSLSVPMQLKGEDIRNVVMMGPNAHHAGAALEQRDGAIVLQDPETPLAVDARFTLSVFQKGAR